MPGVSLGVTLPTVGVTAGPQYATDINTAIQTIIDDVEEKIVLSEIDVTQNWSFRKDGTSYAITDMNYVEFYPVTSDPNGTGIIYAKDVVGVTELFYDDGTNTPFALTSGGELNAASVNGINGEDYGTLGYEVLWTTAATRYDFKDGLGADDMAVVAAAEYQIRDGSNSLTLDVDTLSGDLTWNLPATLPATDEGLLKIDSLGNVDHATAFTPEGGVFDISGELECTTLDVDGIANILGVATLQDNLDVTGDITGLSVVQGTNLKYTSLQVFQMSACEGTGIGTGSPVDVGQGPGFNVGSTDSVQWGLAGLRHTDNIELIQVWCYATGSVDYTARARMYRMPRDFSGGLTQIGSSGETVVSATGDFVCTFDALEHEIDLNYFYWIEFDIKTYTSGNCYAHAASVEVKRT